jgi:hypothetical protein
MILNIAHVPYRRLKVWFYIQIIWIIIWELKIVLANGSTRAWPNRWMGGGQAHIHQVKSTSCTPPTPRDHVGRKRRAYVHDQVGGWGEGGIYTPAHAKWSHATLRRLYRLYARLPFKKFWLNNQSIYVQYLLTELSASQTGTWHVYFRIYHTYKSILTLSERGTWAAVEERKEPPARGAPHALDCLVRSRKVYS